MQPYLAVDGVVGDLTSQGELCRPAVASWHGRQATGGAVEVEDALGGHDTHPNLLERAVDLAAAQAQPCVTGPGDIQRQVQLDDPARTQPGGRVRGGQSADVRRPASQRIQFLHRLLPQEPYPVPGGQRQFARDAHLVLPALGGHRVGVGPVAHPSQPDAAPLDLLEGLCGVEVLTGVGETDPVVLGEERGAVEVADEVLGC